MKALHTSLVTAFFAANAIMAAQDPLGDTQVVLNALETIQNRDWSVSVSENWDVGVMKVVVQYQEVTL